MGEKGAKGKRGDTPVALGEITSGGSPARPLPPAGGGRLEPDHHLGWWLHHRGSTRQLRRRVPPLGESGKRHSCPVIYSIHSTCKRSCRRDPPPCRCA